MGFYKANINKERKIIYIELSDIFSNEETLEATKDFWTKLAYLGKNSSIVCDISKLKNGSRVSRILLQKVMKLICSYEPKAVIRVIKGYDGAMLFDRAYLNIEANYKLYRVDSIEQANNIIETLDNIPPVFRDTPSVN